MNIVVLAGGLSPERNVSLTSGSLISAALRRKGHKVLMIDVYEGLKNTDVDPMALFTNTDTAAYSAGSRAPTPEELEEIKRKNGNRNELIGENVIKMCKLADVTFLALHGDMGENGQLQGTLDIFDITYTGSGYIGSLLAMDKDIAKKLLRDAGVLTPESVKIDFDQSEEAPRFSAHVEYTQNEYLKFVQAKIVRFLQLIFISRIWKQERFS